MRGVATAGLGAGTAVGMGMGMGVAETGCDTGCVPGTGTAGSELIVSSFGLFCLPAPVVCVWRFCSAGGVDVDAV